MESSYGKSVLVAYVVPSYNNCYLVGKELRKRLIQNVHVCPEEAAWEALVEKALIRTKRVQSCK